MLWVEVGGWESVVLTQEEAVVLTDAVGGNWHRDHRLEVLENDWVLQEE